MEIELSKFLASVSFALDYVENEFVQAVLERIKSISASIPPETYNSVLLMHVAPFHSKRVAVLANRMATAMNMDPKSIYALTHAALLHDFALSEYYKKYQEENIDITATDLKPHCISGEKIVSGLPFYDAIKSVILYHHEQANGSGPFGKLSSEIPIGSQLIHLADDIDIRFTLNQMDEEKFKNICDFVSNQSGTLYSDECVKAFFSSVDYELMQSITDENSLKVLNSLIPCVRTEISIDLLRKMSLIFAEITDYKSEFTCRHSLGIAEKAEAMGHYYGRSDEICNKLYVAGALHDIGKLFISNDILEKPGKLTSDEYKAVQNHAMGTWKLLSGIGGLEEITSWAANHHEKLDGSGYPYGKTAEELNANERLMACLDIYQALVEERPYKSGLSHSEAMAILVKMGNEGQLDKDIIADIDNCFKVAESPEPERKANVEPQKTYAGEAWKCPVCGYVFEGELPGDFICPQCEQPGSIFERIN